MTRQSREIRNYYVAGSLAAYLTRIQVTHPKQVFAVVFETTGDVSAVKKSDEIDLWLFEEIRRAEKLESSTPT